MPDMFTIEQRSEIMRRVKSKNTSLERRVRSALHKRGLRYRLGYPLPGNPDIVFVRARLAVFVDSCFWHGCPEHCRMPEHNRQYWQRKIERTMARDLGNVEVYRQLGWRMLRVWEHDLKRDFDGCISQIEEVVKPTTTATACESRDHPPVR